MERNEIPERPQKLTLDDRKRLTVTGVQDVENFDETTVALDTCRGMLIVRGRELRLKQLDGGQVAIHGQVDALLYEENRREGGFLNRLLR